MSDDVARHRLQSVELDDESLAAASRDQEQERQIAIFDLLEDNHFVPDGATGGPYDLRIALIDNRLALDINAGICCRSRRFEGWSKTIIWCARAISKRSETRHHKESKHWIWGGGACTTKAPPSCARDSPEKSKPTKIRRGACSP